MKLPPYAKQIIDARLEGRHPWEAVIGFGPKAKWRECVKLLRGSGLPFVFVPTGDYEPGVYDFSFCAGVCTHICLYGEDKHLVPLLIEVGQRAAPVWIHFRGENGKLVQRELSEFLHAKRVAQDGKYHWPDGWSDELDREYERRCLKFFDYCDKVAAHG